MSSSGRGFGHSNDQNGSRPSKFLYAGKNRKIDPWSTNEIEPDDGIEFALQPRNTLLNNKNSRTSPAFGLDDVWSIRKNVQVTQASKEGKALNANTSTSSYYSRHGGLSGNGGLENSIFRKGQDDIVGSIGDHKSWSVSRGSYSYSNKATFSGKNSSPDEQPEDFLETGIIPNRDDGFVDKKNLINSKFCMAGAPRMASREMSARTQRAKKMHDAHLRSMGMGQHAPHSGSLVSSNEDQEKGTWRQEDEDPM